MSTQPQRDIIRDGFANIPANQSTDHQAAPGARTTDFKDRPILTQPTEAELKLAFAENLFDLFRAMTHLPNAELEEMPGLSRHFAFPFNPMFKGVWQTRLAASETENAIVDSLAWFKARNAPFFFWWVDPQAHPADLAERLKAHGFAAWEENAPGMAAEMNDLRFDLITRVPPGFEMRRVQDERDLLDFKTAFVAGMEIPEWAGQAWVDATLAYGIERAPWKPYVGRWNGKPVASNMLFCGAGVASVFGVATAPEARGQGIGAAITLIAYDDARQLGYRYGVLFATDLGAPVYRRIGFKDVGVGISRYLWRAS
jgi:GNAT superfamily N-acetyltransferase